MHKLNKIFAAGKSPVGMCGLVGVMTASNFNGNVFIPAIVKSCKVIKDDNGHDCIEFRVVSIGECKMTFNTAASNFFFTDRELDRILNHVDPVKKRK